MANIRKLLKRVNFERLSVNSSRLSLLDPGPDNDSRMVVIYMYSFQKLAMIVELWLQLTSGYICTWPKNWQRLKHCGYTSLMVIHYLNQVLTINCGYSLLVVIQVLDPGTDNDWRTVVTVIAYWWLYMYQVFDQSPANDSTDLELWFLLTCGYT